MCGIGGFVSEELNQSHLDAFLLHQKHRGPDAYGKYYDYENRVGLCHNRLSIIDLTESANQPMHSEEDRYSVVFNGEIYNYLELKEELTAYSFKTNSDTEVLLAGFKEWGPTFVTKLIGMFSFVIYDKHTQELWVYRDRLGIKPLFFYQDEKTFAFSSELHPLTVLFKKKLSIDKNSISDFLHLGYIPEPKTAWVQLLKFPAGHYACVKNKQITNITAYWTASDLITKDVITDENEAKNILKIEIEKAVERRLVSDVPFGTFLSGGIDSSLVTAIASQKTNEKLKTFSIGFEDKNKNEAPYARAVAEHLQTDHHEFIVNPKDIEELLTEITTSYQEPYADSSAFPTMLVSKLARQHVTMTLSGDGGDELFHGYGAYTWAERLNHNYWRVLKAPVSTLLSFGDNRMKRVAKLIDFPNNGSLNAHIFSQEQYMFTAKEVSKLRNTNYSFQYKSPKVARKLSSAEEQALFDLNYYLKDDLLTKVDRASMKFSLEARVPLLDHNVVQAALNISPSLKMKNGEQKYILKQLLYDYVPKPLFERPKQGFSIPLNKWLRNEHRYLADLYLSKSFINRYGIIDYKCVEKLYNNFYFNNADYLYNRVWLLIVLGMWLEKYA